MSRFLKQWAGEKPPAAIVENVSKRSMAGGRDPDVLVPEYTPGSFVAPSRLFRDPRAAEALKDISDLLVVSYERYRKVRRVPVPAPETVNKELALPSSPSVHGHGLPL